MAAKKPMGKKPNPPKKTVLSKKESAVYAKAKKLGVEVPGRTIRVENGDMSTGVEYSIAPFGFGKNQKGSQNRARKTKQKER